MKHPRYARSIRLRLTAWYTLVLVLIVLVLGLGISYVLERELRAYVDNQLLATATDMTAQFEVGFRFERPVVIVPPPDAFSFPSQLIQVVDTRGQIWFRTENLDARSMPVDLEAVEAGAIRFSSTVIDGVTVRILTYPIEIQDTVVGSVVVGEPLIQVTRTLDDLRRQFLVASLFGVGLALLGGWFITPRALKPVDEMTATARRIVGTSSDALPLGARLSVPGTGDEVARLGETINDLLARLEQALDTQSRFVADASHELRTPLTAVQGNIDLLERQLERSNMGSLAIEETISELRRESRRMTRLVGDLLTLARLESPTGLSLDLELHEIGPIADDAVRTAKALHPTTAFDIEREITAQATVDAPRIEQVMVILLDNASRASDAGSAVTLSCRSDDKSVTIVVADRGAGIATEDLPNVFERFFRADSSRQRASGGTGLGLAIAHAVVKAHDGTIEIESEPGQGTIVTMTLPRQPANASIGHDLRG